MTDNHTPSLTACRDCRYWHEEKALMQTPQGPSRVGQCLRFPPQIAIVLTQAGSQPTSLFPVTLALQSCGEFGAKALVQA